MLRCVCEVYGVDRLVVQLESSFGTLLLYDGTTGSGAVVQTLTTMKFCKALVSNHWVALKEHFIAEKIPKLFSA